MKEKTSITLSPEVLAGIDHIAGPKISRSKMIEAILSGYLREQAKVKTEVRDLNLLNRESELLNAEAADVLDFQSSEAED